MTGLQTETTQTEVTPLSGSGAALTIGKFLSFSQPSLFLSLSGFVSFLSSLYSILPFVPSPILCLSTDCTPFLLELQMASAAYVPTFNSLPTLTQVVSNLVFPQFFVQNPKRDPNWPSSSPNSQNPRQVSPPIYLIDIFNSCPKKEFSIFFLNQHNHLNLRVFGQFTDWLPLNWGQTMSHKLKQKQVGGIGRMH